MDIRPKQLRERRADLQYSAKLKRVAKEFLVDRANGIEGIRCPDDTFKTPSVFAVSYRC